MPDPDHAYVVGMGSHFFDQTTFRTLGKDFD